MSFRCGFCGRAQPAGRKAEKVVTEVRQIIGEEVIVEDDGRVGHTTGGREIVKEVLACSSCAAIYRQRGPKVVEVKTGVRMPPRESGRRRVFGRG